MLSEGWIGATAFPNCGATPLTAFAANSRVADFHCGVCAEEFELKATKGRIDRKLANGTYGAMTARLAATNNISAPRSGSSFRCCGIAAGWNSMDAGRSGGPERLSV